MDNDLIEEINYEIQLLIKSGFYNKNEILELIEDEFFEEAISLEDIKNLVSKNYANLDIPNHDSIDFTKLENVFNQLTGLNEIIAIHNAGYDLEEGVQDAFELFVHMRNNKYSPKGFCFYSFENIEIAIEEETLSLVFGDFESDERKALKIGKTIVGALESNGFSINWDNSLDSPIEIKPFLWKKVYTDKEYSMDGALNTYLEFHK